MSDSLWPHELQHVRPPCPSPTPGVHSNSCPSSQWCHPAISSSVVPFSSCPQSISTSESFPMSQLFTWDGQSTGVSTLPSFLPKNTQDRSPLEWTGWISLQSMGLSRVFSNLGIELRSPALQADSLPAELPWKLSQFSSVQSLSCVRLFATPWITARQASLSITNSWSSLRLNVHRVSDTIQPSHPLSSPFPPAPNPSQHQSLFQWVSSSHEGAKVLEFRL